MDNKTPSDNKNLPSTNEKGWVDKALDKIPIDKIYEDLLQPSFKVIGRTLESVFSLGDMLLLPLKLRNAKAQARFKKHMEEYQKKLDQIPEEDQCEVQEQLGLSIIEKLITIDPDNQKELSEIFLNLLTKGSSTKTLHLVHPAFINTLSELSQDEAIILFAHRNSNRIQMIDINLRKTVFPEIKPDALGKKGVKTKEELLAIKNYNDNIEITNNLYVPNLTAIGEEDSIKLYFPNNMPIYLDNLFRLGIITFTRNKYNVNEIEKYQNLKKHYEKIIQQCKEISVKKSTENMQLEILIDYGFINFTDFGQAFLDAVAKDISELSTEEDEDNK